MTANDNYRNIMIIICKAITFLQFSKIKMTLDIQNDIVLT